MQKQQAEKKKKLYFSCSEQICISERICCSSNGPVRHSVEDVSNEVDDKLKDLKEVAEGDAKPERQASTQGTEKASILRETLI